jgi:catechol 2,3-dioxygenase-like lactoylglutathione lyase family enzyme
MDTRKVALAWLSVALMMFAAVALVVGVCWAAERAERPKISGIAFVRIKVTNMDAAQAFYHGTLRLPQLRSGCFGFDQSCLFVNMTQQIDLVDSGGPATGSQIDSVGFFTSDARALHQYLSAKGWKPGELGANSSTGATFEVKDPDNHTIIFVQSPKGFGGDVMGAPPISSKLIHVGFVVKNRDAMDDFYKNALGFHLYWHGGMKDGQTDWVAMQVPDGTDWVEYMLNVPENADKRLLGVMNHISLGVPDIHEAANQLEKAGFQVTEDPKIGRDGKWQLNLYDQDQTRVELMEFKPAQKPCCSEFTGPHPGP